MRRRWLVLAGAFGVILASPAVAPAAETVGSVNFSVGKTKLDQDLEPADDQTGFGVQMSFGKEGWPVLFAIDLMFSAGDGTQSYSYYGLYYGKLDVDVRTNEFAVGVRKEWGKKSIHPFIGGGLQWTYTNVDADFIAFGVTTAPFVDDSDSSVNYWANAGLYWRLGKHFNLGVNVRYRDSEATLREEFFGTEADFDTSGVHYGALFGVGW